jgi:diguanylate cyclase (GGDEF)-like protein
MGSRFLGADVRVRKGAENLPGLRSQVTRQKTEIASLTNRVSEIEPLLKIEPKTGLLNESGMWEDILKKSEEIRRESEGMQPGDGLGFVFYDFINFKLLNDTLGQEAGDVVIKKAAAILLEEHRSQDGIVRYGGDENLGILKVGSEEELKNIIQGTRLNSDKQPTPSILDAVNTQMQSFMRERYPDFVETHGDVPGTFRSGLTFLTNEEIISTPSDELQNLVRNRLNILTMQVKAKGHSN